MTNSSADERSRARDRFFPLTNFGPADETTASQSPGTSRHDNEFDRQERARPSLATTTRQEAKRVSQGTKKSTNENRHQDLKSQLTTTTLQEAQMFPSGRRRTRRRRVPAGPLCNLFHSPCLAHTRHCLAFLLGLLLVAGVQVHVRGQQQNFNNNNNNEMLVAEPRAADGPNLPSALKPPLGNANNPNNIALNQLVSFLNSLNNQQQQQGQQAPNQRRSPQPLPLGAMGQRSFPGQPTSSSTPVNPFAAAANFQPTRRQQTGPFGGQPGGVQFNGQQAGGAFTPAPPAPASSPPALTLNRIANQFQASSFQAGPRFTNSQQLKPLNTIPLGGGALSPASPGPGASSSQQPQQQGGRAPVQSQRRPQIGPFPPVQQPGQQQQQQPPPRSALMPPPQPPQTSTPGLRPISGFAPSGPPPSSASNAAISVVQSPANAIGQPPASSSPFDMPLGSPPASSTASSAASSTPAATTVASSSASSPAPQASPEGSSASSSEPTSTAATSARPQSSPESGSSTPPATTLTMIASSTPSSAAGTTTEQQPSSSTNSNSNSNQSAAPTQEPPGQPTSVASDSTGAPNSSWNPVQAGPASNRSRPPATSLAPSPDIVTVPPGYNPDAPPAPQNYDISVSAQMGGGGGSSPSAASPAGLEPPAGTQASRTATPALAGGQQATGVVVAAAPTETTTIIWSSEAPSASATSSSTRPPIQATRVQQQQVGASSTQASPSGSTTGAPSRIRDSSQMMMQNDEPIGGDPGVVYGKAAGREAAKPPGQQQQQQQAGRPFIATAQLDTQVRPFPAGSQPVKSNHGGLPFKPSRQIGGPASTSSSGGSGMSVGSGFHIAASGNQTMPTGDIQDYVAGAPPPIVSMGSSQSSQSSGGGGAEPTISAQGGPDPATFDLAPEASSRQQQQSSDEQPASGTTAAPATAATSSPAPPRLRRPTFKPKPAVPPIRIDSCIVGDDSSCDQSHNERCVTEYGISSCHCKPGFARLSQLRGYCSPISLLQFNMKIDRLSDDRRLAYNASLENPNSEEYQYLEFETIQALASGMQQTALAKQFMGARVNKFYERKNKVWANVSLNLELNNMTRNEQKIQQIAHSELLKLAQLKQKSNQPLGESTIVLDGSRDSISKLVDVNECASRELNDCSKHATCTNEFGGYSCQCLAGYEDKALVSGTSQVAAAALTASGSSGSTGGGSAESGNSPAELKAKLGRVCMGCSASYCSNRGECFIQEGKKQCKCRANFMGSRCDIDSEVLAVAIGGSLVGLGILIVTFWCLFIYNRRWRREQQKMDAMSATSGLTYNYVNSNANSNAAGLMSPAAQSRHLAGLGVGGGGGGGQGGRSAAYTMGHRFSQATGGVRNHSAYLNHQHHHAADQQAIIGSTSSGSSAASQPIACNPYAPGNPYSSSTGAYDEGLLIAPASTGSSEQTSPSANSYRGIMGHHHQHQHHHHSNHSAAMLAAAGNAYTLSGHHHHNHHQQQLQMQQQHLIQQQQLAAAAAHHMHHQHHHGPTNTGKQLTQFHPSAMMDYATRTLTSSSQQQGANYCPPSANGYDSRWRTLQQADNKQQSSLAAYYLVR